MKQNILKPKSSKEILLDFSNKYNVSFEAIKNFVKTFKLSTFFTLSSVQGRVMFFLGFLVIGLVLGFLGEIFTKINFQLTGALLFISGCIIILSGGLVALLGDGENNNW